MSAGGDDATRPVVRVSIRRLEQAADLPLPAPATADAAGLDLRARLDADCVIPPGGRVRIPTGIAVALPPGHEAQIRPRSGLALEFGLTLVNSPGTIDADYRGEISVIAINLGQQPVTVRRGDRVAQMVVQQLPRVVFQEVDQLPPSSRGAGGFGHTGL